MRSHRWNTHFTERLKMERMKKKIEMWYDDALDESGTWRDIKKKKQLHVDMKTA